MSRNRPETLSACPCAGRKRLQTKAAFHAIPLWSDGVATGTVITMPVDSETAVLNLLILPSQRHSKSLSMSIQPTSRQIASVVPNLIRNRVSRPRSRTSCMPPEDDGSAECSVHWRPSSTIPNCWFNP